MPQHATIVPLNASIPGIKPAIVTEYRGIGDHVSVCIAGDTTDRHARMAMYPHPPLSVDDEVLTMTDTGGQTYVIGVLACRKVAPESAATIRLADGALARMDHTADGESLKLYSRENELLIDYRAQTGTVKINAASGNLEFSATNGSIAFHAAKDVHIDGNNVGLNARTDLHVGVQDPNGAAGPSMSMKSRKMHLAAPVLDLTARRAQLFIQETQIAGKKLLGRIGEVQFITRKIESVADTVMAKAKNVYRTVSQLSQLKAGRQRTLIEKTCHMKAQKTIFKSETDFKVKAEKIHLG